MAQTAIEPGDRGHSSVKRVAHDKWTARTRLRLPNGQYRDMRRSRSTRNAALQALDDACVDERSRWAGVGTLPPSATLREAIRGWVTVIPEGGYSEETERGYRIAASGIEKRFSDRILDAAFRQLTPAQLSMELHSYGVERGLGALKLARTVLRNVGQHAVMSGVLQVNIARDANASARSVRREREKAGVKEARANLDTERAFTIAEAREVATHIDTDERSLHLNMEPLLHTLRGTGMRIGEACDLRWEHVDFEAGQIAVPGTKTKAADRTIRAPQWLLDMMEVWQSHGGEWVCPTALGGQRDKTNAGHFVRELFDKWGFEWASSHTFRRTVATRLDEAGLSAREIADHLGHARPSMTQDKYMGRRTISRGGALL